MHRPQLHYLATRWEGARGALAEIGPEVLEQPASRWVKAEDRHLPQALLPWTLGALVVLSFEEVMALPGIGIGKVERLADLLERAKADPDPAPDRAAPAKRPLEVEPEQWQEWRRRIVAHGLQDEALGRLVPALTELPPGLWGWTLDQVLELSPEVPGLGTARWRAAVAAVRGIIDRLDRPDSAPEEATGLTVWLIPRAVLRAEVAVRRLGDHPETVADADLEADVLAPLLAQLVADVGPEVAEVVARRLGGRGPRQTLEEVARSRNLTRERIRQIEARGLEAMRRRWPEAETRLNTLGRRLADADRPELAAKARDLAAMLSPPDADAQLAGEVMRSLRRAARAKLTPIDAADLVAWLSRDRPGADPASALRRVMRTAPRVHDEEGTAFYLSDDEFDQILLKVLETDGPVSLDEAIAAADWPDDPISTRRWLARDPRFIEDDDGTYRAALRCGLRCRAGQWRLALRPVGPPRADSDRPAEVSLDAVMHLVLGGLGQLGVADATVWGVHRIATELLEALHGARPDAAITPFVLARLLINHSKGAIRTMRRRRLRWSAPGIEVRGKRGWVGYVVNQAGVPMLLEELDVALREYYQDYEIHVINQLAGEFDDPEEEAGTGALPVRFESAPGRGVPAVIVPGDWSPPKNGIGREDVSPGVRDYAIDIGRARNRYGPRLSKAHFAHVPWLVGLIEREAGGHFPWAPHMASRTRLAPGG